MRNRSLRAICIVFILLATFAYVTKAAETDPPVKIAFDEKSERIDLLTKEALPDYTEARRGSVQFHHYKLDKPDRFVSFTHDGVRNVNIDDLRLMEKVQQRFAVWRLRYKSGRKNTPRIQHLAVSFVPLDENGKPGDRVYLLLNDLNSIAWEE